MGKIKSVSHKKAPPTFIDDVLEKFRVHNQLEEQKTRQMSLPASVKDTSQLIKLPKLPLADDVGAIRNETRHILRESGDQKQPTDTHSAQISTSHCRLKSNNDDTLAMLKQTGEMLKTLSSQMQQVKYCFLS